MQKTTTSFFMRTAVAIALLFATAGSAAAYDFMYNGLAYNYDGDGTSVYVTYTSTNSDNYGGSLTNVVIPAKITLEGNVSYNVTGIGQSAFSNCSNLQSITIPASVKTIGAYAFSETIIKKLTVSSVDSWLKTTLNSVISTPHEMYVGSSLLTSVTVPSTVTTVGSHFSNVTSIKSVTIPNSVTEIGNSAFAGCTSLATLNLGSGVKTIGQYAFSGCAALTSVTFPSSLKTIGFNAFGNCSSLTSLTIPENIETIEYNVFEGCTNVKTLVWNAINLTYNGGIPTTNIETVTIGNKVQTIPNNFASGSKIKTVTFPVSLQTIGASAFKGCNYLSSILLPDNVSTIGAYAFQNCSSCTKLIIPEKLTNYGTNAFNGCDNVTDLTWNAINCSSCYGMSFGKVTKFKFGDNVSYVPDNFMSGSKIISLTIPESVTQMSRVFLNCSLVKLRVKSKNIKYDNYSAGPAFHGTNIQVSLVPNSENTQRFPNQVVLDPNTSFEVDGITYVITDMTNRWVKIVDIDETKCATDIEVKNVKYHNVEFTPTELGIAALAGNYTVKSISLGNIINYIPAYSFYESALTKANVRYNIVLIGQHAFENCKQMTEFVLDTRNTYGVNTIDQYVLAGCSALRRVELGPNVAYINANSFNGCSKIKTLRVRRSTPPNATSGVFNDLDKWSCTLYVPKGTVDTYKNANEWKTFFFISDDETEPSSGDVNGDGKVNVSDVSVLISMILGTTTMDEGTADVNGDGKVNVSDVSALINIILGIK